MVKHFFAKLFCASKKATVSRAFAKRAPFLLLLSGTKEVNIGSRLTLEIKSRVVKDKSSVEDGLSLGRGAELVEAERGFD